MILDQLPRFVRKRMGRPQRSIITMADIMTRVNTRLYKELDSEDSGHWDEAMRQIGNNKRKV